MERRSVVPLEYVGVCLRSRHDDDRHMSTRALHHLEGGMTGKGILYLGGAISFSTINVHMIFIDRNTCVVRYGSDGC